MLHNTNMYKSKYEPVDGLPLTTTIPELLEWKGVSPQKVEDVTGGKVKQANIHRICKGETRGPGQGVVEGIATFFGLSFAQINDIEFVRAYIAGNGKPVSLVEISTPNKDRRVSEPSGLDYAVRAALTDQRQVAAVMKLADQASPRDAIVIAEYFLARAKAGLPES